MPTPTDNLGFQRPTVAGDLNVWGGYLNANWEISDVVMQALGRVTRAGITTSTLDPSITPVIYTSGYSTPGDGGGAKYKYVATEPSHAGKVQSADGAWWELANDVLNYKMFGAVGDSTTDDTTAIRNANHAAIILGKPIIDGGKYRYTAQIVVGSLDTTAPAAGFADGFTLIGSPRITFVVDGAHTSDSARIRLIDCSDVAVKHVRFDVNTAATQGAGQVRFENVDGFRCKDVKKIRKGTAFTTGGSSAVALSQDSRNGYVNGVITRNCGPTSSAVFAIGGKISQIRNIECTGGQEALDLSACADLTGNNIKGYNVGAVMEAANTVRSNFSGIYGKNVTRGIICKTEISGDHDLGANDNTFENILIEEFTENGIAFQAGATTTQTLHRNRFRKGRLVSTTIASSTAVAILLVSGDVTADPNNGSEFDGFTIGMNAGAAAIGLPGMVNYRFANILANAPVLVQNNTPSSFVSDTNGVWEKIVGTGNFTTIHRKITVDDLSLTNGRFRALDSLYSDFRVIKIYDAQTNAIHIEFSNTSAITNKGVTLTDFEVVNNSIGGASNFGLLIDAPATQNANNIHVRRGVIRDTQGTPTSGAVKINNLVTDFCTLEGVRTENIAQNSHYGFVGLNSRNYNNHFHNQDVITNTGSITLNQAFMRAKAVRQTAAGTITIPTNATTAFQIGQKWKWVHAGGVPTFAAATGVVIRSNGSLLSVSNNGSVVLEKIDTDEWQLTGDLA